MSGGGDGEATAAGGEAASAGMESPRTDRGASSALRGSVSSASSGFSQMAPFELWGSHSCPADAVRFNSRVQFAIQPITV